MSNKDENPVMKMHEAQANVITKEAEIGELRRRIEELERERQERNQGEPGRQEKIAPTNSNLLERKTTGEDRVKGGNETILIMGGERNLVSLDEMVILDRKTSTWKVMDMKLPCKNGHGGSALLNGEIYIFGGWGLQKKLYKLYKLDSQQMKWIKLAEMNEERKHISNGSLVFQGCIWVFGGMKMNGEILKTVEKYYPERKEWIKMPGMSKKRADAAAAVCNEKIFVSGGSSVWFFMWTYLKSVECFDPISGVWTPMVDMPGGRDEHSMFSDGSSLFVMGGWDGKSYIKTVWRIRPNEKNAAWEELKPMNEERRRFTAKFLCCSTPDDKKEIYAIGGWNGKGYLDSVEIFDGESWRKGPKLPNECCSMSSVVIPLPWQKLSFSVRTYETHTIVL